MTDTEKTIFFRACELADKISEETELFAEVNYQPEFRRKVNTHWFKHNGDKCVGHGCAYGFDNIVPYLETVYQFAPRRCKDGAR